MGGGVKLGSMYWEIGADNAPLNSALSQSEDAVNRFGNQSSNSFNALAVAAGSLLANGVMALVGGLKNLAGSAVQATADYQAMQVGLEGLLAREIARGTEAERTTQVFVKGKDAETEKIAALQVAYDGYAISLDKARYHLAEISKTQGPGDIDFRKYANDVANYEQKLAATQARMESLKGTAGHMESVVEKYMIGTTTIGEAMPEAQKKAKGLMDELAKIAILSPYQVENVQQTYKLAMAFGYTSDQAKDYTKAILDVAAGTGASNETLGRMAYNFAQIRMQGKVTAMDIRQLAMAGFDLTSVLKSVGEQYGVNIKDHEDFNAAIASGKISWEQFTTGFAKYAKDNFGGASERLAKTLNGLKSTFKDVFVLTFPKLLGRGAEAVTGLLQDMLDGFLKIRESGVLDELGNKIGAWTEGMVGKVRDVVDLPGVIKDLLAADPRNLAELNDILSRLPASMRGIAMAGAEFIEAYQSGGMAGAFDVVKGWAGEAWGKIRDWWDDNGEQWAKDTAGKILDWLKAIPGKLVDIGMSAGAWLADTWRAMGDWWNTNGQPWVENIAGKIGTWLGNLGTFLKSEKVPGWVNEAMFWLEDTWLGMSKWWESNIQPLTDSMVAGVSAWMTTSFIPALENTDKSTWTAGIGASITQAFEGVGLWFEQNDQQVAYSFGNFLAQALVKGAALLLEASLLPAAFQVEIGKAIKNLLTNTKGNNGGWEVGNWLVAGIVDGLESAIEGNEFLKRVRAAIDGFVVKVKEALGIKSPSTVFASIGSSLVDGLIEGMENAKDRLISFVLDWARRVIPQPLWSFFGIASPSKMMAEIGDNLVAGLALGIERSSQAQTRAMVGADGRNGVGFSGAATTPAAGAQRGFPSITNNIYMTHGEPELVRSAANRGVMDALQASGFR